MGCCSEVDTTVNPVSIAAFVMTCVGCLLTVVSVFLNNWWAVSYSTGGHIMYGVWSKTECASSGLCRLKPATELEGGQETLFISKVFTTLTALLFFVALIFHVVYFFVRKPLVRTLAIFMLGAAALFGVLAILVFVGFYTNLDGNTSLGVAFALFLVGVILCLAATVVTAWASIRKAISPSGLVGMD